MHKQNKKKERNQKSKPKTTTTIKQTARQSVTQGNNKESKKENNNIQKNYKLVQLYLSKADLNKVLLVRSLMSLGNLLYHMAP